MRENVSCIVGGTCTTIVAQTLRCLRKQRHFSRFPVCYLVIHTCHQKGTVSLRAEEYNLMSACFHRNICMFGVTNSRSRISVLTWTKLTSFYCISNVTLNSYKKPNVLVPFKKRVCSFLCYLFLQHIEGAEDWQWASDVMLGCDGSVLRDGVVSQPGCSGVAFLMCSVGCVMYDTALQN